MPRLQQKNGVVVNVSDETAERLMAEGGWSEAEAPKRATKKAASKSDSK